MTSNANSVVPTRVLLVDDDPVFRESLRIVLNRFPEGCVCILASSVAEATAELANNSIDLAIIDIHLPDGTAADIIRVAGSIPCMLCSQDRQEPTFKKMFDDRSLRHNIVGYLTKPIQSDVIWNIRVGLEIGRERQERNHAVAIATVRVEEERRKIAQNLHDQMGSSLTQLTWIFASLEKMIQANEGLDAPFTEKISEICDKGKEVVKEAHQEISRTVIELRPEAVNIVGLRSAIEFLIMQWGETAPTVKFECSLSNDACSLDSGRAGIVYRIVQEGITNIMRHTAANEVFVQMKCRGKQLLLSVHSKGRILEEKSNYALVSLYERTTSLGGVLQFICDPERAESKLNVTISI